MVQLCIFETPKPMAHRGPAMNKKYPRTLRARRASVLVSDDIDMPTGTRARSISFARAPQVFEMEPCFAQSPSDELHYSEADYRRFRLELHNEIAQVCASGCEEESKERTMRGLEGFVLRCGTNIVRVVHQTRV